eukprot:jgi/Mesvir1/15883/Mv02791-RA.1
MEIELGRKLEEEGSGEQATVTFVKEAPELASIIDSVVNSRGDVPLASYRRAEFIFSMYQEQPYLLDPHLEGVVGPLMELMQHYAHEAAAAGTAPTADTSTSASQDAGDSGRGPPRGPDLTCVRRVGRLVYVLASVRGHKTVVRFFPHNAADLEPAVALLCLCQQPHTAGPGGGAPGLQYHVTVGGSKGVPRVGGLENDASSGEWETLCTLLLWLSMIVLIPFDLASVDTSLVSGGPHAEEGAAAGEEGSPPLVRRLVGLCRAFLHSSGAVRDMAVVLLARLLTRPDMGSPLRAFMEWAIRELAGVGDGDTTKATGPGEEVVSAACAAELQASRVFLIPGLLAALAALFKVGGRDRTLPVSRQAWGPAISILSGSSGCGAGGVDGGTGEAVAGTALTRKLCVKLVQRIALTFLEPRVVAWRYERGSRTLVQNLAATATPVAAGLPTASTAEAAGMARDLRDGGQGPAKLAGAGGGCMGLDSGAPEEEEDFDVPEEIEDAVGKLLASLRDQDTVVRWSAAKGLGRMTSRLPLVLGDEVLSALVDILSPSEGDSAWHGGCLALAELARRGLLLPSRLDTVVPVVVKALHYDVRRGPHSVGSHVRDAAAYVCWSFARAYAPDVMGAHLRVLAPALLTIAVYDREVNCRRAAAAAFQECVGRLGNFPHAISILTAADFFTLGARRHAYLQVAPFIGSFDEYRPALAEHLLHTKLMHWEKALRELAAEALAALVPFDVPFFAGPAMSTLLGRTLSEDLPTRHGAILGVARVVQALAAAGHTFNPELQEQLGQLVPRVEKARLYCGKGGEIVRGAVCQHIRCVAAVGLQLSKKLAHALYTSLVENLRHPTPQIQESAVDAFRAFSRSYLLSPLYTLEEALNLAPRALMRVLATDDNAAARRGAALALGALPLGLLAPLKDEVILTLCAATTLEEDEERRDAETRVNAVKGLVGTCEEMGIGKEAHGGQAAHASEGAAAAPSAEVSAAPVHAHAPGTLDAVVVCGRVFPALLACLGDYTVDNRGDVGSWVREAAMEALQRCTMLLCRGQQGADASANSAPAVDNGGSQPCGGATASSGAAHDSCFSEDLARQLVGALAKQAVEKIDRIRCCAGTVLQALLASCDPFVPHVPHREQLEALICPLGVIINWAAPAESFPRLVPLLQFDAYRDALLSGLVISAGGMSDSLGRASATALLSFLEQAERGGKAAGDGVPLPASASEPPFLRRFVASLLAILAREGKNDRVIVPALKVLQLLYASQVFTKLTVEEHCALLALVRKETSGCKDVAKLMLISTVICHISEAPQPARGQSLQALLNLLVFRYPKVRKHCAEALYLRLLSMDSEDMPPEESGMPSIGDALEILSETAWDAPVAEVKTKRDLLYGCLGVEPPASEVKAATGTQATTVHKKAQDGGYASLVEEAGY